MAAHRKRRLQRKVLNRRVQAEQGQAASEHAPAGESEGGAGALDLAVDLFAMELDGGGARRCVQAQHIVAQPPAVVDEAGAGAR